MSLPNETSRTTGVVGNPVPSWTVAAALQRAAIGTPMTAFNAWRRSKSDGIVRPKRSRVDVESV